MLDRVVVVQVWGNAREEGASCVCGAQARTAIRLFGQEKMSAGFLLQSDFGIVAKFWPLFHSLFLFDRCRGDISLEGLTTYSSLLANFFPLLLLFPLHTLNTQTQSSVLRYARTNAAEVGFVRTIRILLLLLLLLLRVMRRPSVRVVLKHVIVAVAAEDRREPQQHQLYAARARFCLTRTLALLKVRYSFSEQCCHRAILQQRFE